MTSSGSEIGIPDLEEHLRKYIERVRGGEEIVVTDDGRPVARLSPIDGPRNRPAELVAAGVVRAPTEVSDLSFSGRCSWCAMVSRLVGGGTSLAACSPGTLHGSGRAGPQRVLSSSTSRSRRITNRCDYPRRGRRRSSKESAHRDCLQGRRSDAAPSAPELHARRVLD